MRGALRKERVGSLPCLPARLGQAAGELRQASARKKQPAPQGDSARLRRPKRPRNERQLEDLISVGPAIARDLELLGVHSVAELAKRDPQRLYRKLERLTGQRQDPCVLDTFCAAVAQARNPRLDAAQCQWWWWSRKRKQNGWGPRELRTKTEGSKETTR